MNLSPKTLLLLLALMASACNTATTEETPTPTLTPDMPPEEQAYYDSCPTNPECRGFHVVHSGEIAELSGELITLNDEKTQKLLSAAETYIEDFYGKAWADQSQFFPADYPQELKSTREFAVGKVLGYDDQYIYMTMDFTNYYIKEGTLAVSGGSGNIPYRFEYNPLSNPELIINHNEAGEDLENLSVLFPQEILDAYNKIQGTQWETPEQKTAVEERAKAFFNL